MGKFKTPLLMIGLAVLAVAGVVFLRVWGQELPHAWPRDGATQILDNARVSVWDVTWIKGKPSPMHKHRFDLVAVYLVGSAIRVTPEDGPARESTVEPGFVLFQPKGVTHIEEGLVEKNPRHAVMIDLKDHPVAAASNPSTGFPAAFPREGARKVIENDRVVIWDYRWTPGATVPMHYHDKDLVMVFLDGGELRSITLDGQVSTAKVATGDARFFPGKQVHSEVLVGGAARAIITELK